MIQMVDKIDSETWNQFVLKYGPRSGSFLQSFEWGEFQKSLGRKVERISWQNDQSDLMALAQMIYRPLPFFGVLAAMYRGPICAQDILPDLSLLAREAIALHIEPSKDFSFEKGNGLHKHASSSQPQHTFITDLSPSNDLLLAQMHEKTRYNIRLAERKGVTVQWQKVRLQEVWEVFQQTAQRDGFRLHPKLFYEKMLQHTSAFLAIAEHDGDLLATSIMIDFGTTRTYLHGASSNVKRNMMAPYLLHHKLMMDAKNKGMCAYDWWGVAPTDAPITHAWSGISRFKRGFGGEDVSYPGGIDCVRKPYRYTLYQFLRSVRRVNKKKS